jgi:hypothetical protein
VVGGGLIGRVRARRERARRRWAERTRSERAIALVWMALTLTVMVLFAGFAVDLSNWWFQAERLQRAADAGAQAGVVFLPGDVGSATDTARHEVAKNEFNDGVAAGAVNATVTVNQEPNPNRLRVNVSTDVDSFFLGLIGITSVPIEREAVAEYLAPVPMGSPVNKLGGDPETGYDSPQFWINVAGPNANKANGDRFAAKLCSPSTAFCSGTVNPGINNDDYAFNGYFFSADVKTPVPGQNLRFDIYDALMAYTGDKCTASMPTDAQLVTLTTWYPDAAQRYDNALNQWCTGDQDLGGRNARTTFIVREPDSTPWSDTDNPVVDIPTCKPTTLDAYLPGPGGAASPTFFQLLHPSDGIQDAQAVIDPDDGVLTFAEMFHRWATMCEIPAGQVKTGQYLLQIRTNAAAAAPTVYDASQNGGGHNRMSIRVGFGSAGVTAEDGGNVALYARGKLPIYANADGAATNFFLARVMPGDAGRTLRINLHDISDVGASGTMQILPPAENGGTFSGCNFETDNGQATSFSASSCTLTVPNGYYNARVVYADVPIPSDYTCDSSDPEGCWVTVLASFPSSVQDTTTWSAAILGNPVRLVE